MFFTSNVPLLPPFALRFYSFYSPIPSTAYNLHSHIPFSPLFDLLPYSLYSHIPLTPLFHYTPIPFSYGGALPARISWLS